MLQPKDDDQLFKEWFDGTTPPPPLPQDIADQMAAFTAEGVDAMRQRQIRVRNKINMTLRGENSLNESEPIPTRAIIGKEKYPHLIEYDELLRPKSSKHLRSEEDEGDGDIDDGESGLSLHVDTHHESDMDHRTTLYIDEDLDDENNEHDNNQNEGSSQVPTSGSSEGNMTKYQNTSIVSNETDDSYSTSSSDKSNSNQIYANAQVEDGSFEMYNNELRSLEIISIESSDNSNMNMSVDMDDHFDSTADRDSVPEPESNTPSISIVIPSPALKTPRGRPKKVDENITSVASLIGSRRKQSIGQRTVLLQGGAITRPMKGFKNVQASKARVRQSVPIIDLELESDDRRTGSESATSFVNGTDSLSSSDRASPIKTVATLKSTHVNKKTVSIAPSASTDTGGALSGVSIYVIPTNMDSRVFEITRKRVLSLNGSWLGPKVKPLSTDPRIQADLPPLDQEKTTHIVTTLSSIDDVKRILKVETIN
ncbi:hypothetical protein BGZ76_006309, partial [Entomortierella beljakovae]